MENWDLQAILGGSSNNMEEINPPFKSFDPCSFHQEEDDLMIFSEVFEWKPQAFDELQELYKPFYPPESNPYSSQTNVSTSSPPVPQEHIGDEPENQKKQHHVSYASPVSATAKDSSDKPKRSSRKNQQNRVVQHVKADEPPSDMWAWRKYGQKPIKGSPYPRSYYRCSSSKGCLARKQVERSCSDPRTFIVTYTAEHSHGHQPTRRNSLARSNRNKSPTSLANKNIEPQGATDKVLSPISTIQEENVQQESINKMEDFETLGENKIVMPDIMLSSNNEFVEILEDFEGVFVDQFPDLSHELWSMDDSAATLTGGC